MNKLVILGIGIFLCSGLFAQPKVGDVAKDIELRTVNGKQVKLSDYRGKIVLVDFWASWCGPCRKANPGLLALYSKYKQQGFEIFGVSLDEDKSAWKKAIAKDGITWVQVNQDGGWDAPVALQWKIEQLPSSFLLDQNGTVLLIDPAKDELESQLQKLLK